MSGGCRCVPAYIKKTAETNETGVNLFLFASAVFLPRYMYAAHVRIRTWMFKDAAELKKTGHTRYSHILF